ncbi:YidC/Oxa1 family membrane protein insertase [Streptomyces flavofungini]|uniref:Membrane protein insertase YidC n=1 Tax=Streptomyces flavofungini TaxID=68200 RepID=A0ABS0XFW2_9ACTN|nr:YidC/Oxa1 family membrane protein insertase [Streptomyces flavofungini]MBJ3812109.1 YidC/Oxa1 family membrane protein insertase [Streptomyces flavofungini]GHC44189.1 membrane protein [Streptomyces flavofungini]
MSFFASLVADLADLLAPLFHGSAMAAAIVLVTACVRLLVHPLSRAAARGQKARAKLSPQIAALREKHGKNPEKFQKAVMELHREEQVSPLSGCLPGLFQLPAFFLLYHLFSSSDIGGKANELLDHKLFAAPLGGRFADALGDGGLFGAAGLLYLALFALVTAVATFNYRRTKRQLAANPPAAPGGEQAPGANAMAAMGKFMPFMSFMTLFTVAVVPLAAALYVVTSTTWSAVERAVLYRDMPTGAGAMGAAAVL